MFTEPLKEFWGEILTSPHVNLEREKGRYYIVDILEQLLVERRWDYRVIERQLNIISLLFAVFSFVICQSL